MKGHESGKGRNRKNGKKWKRWGRRKKEKDRRWRVEMEEDGLRRA